MRFSFAWIDKSRILLDDGGFKGILKMPRSRYKASSRRSENKTRNANIGRRGGKQKPLNKKIPQTKNPPFSDGFFTGSASRIRTYDQSVNSRLLYRWAIAEYNLGGRNRNRTDIQGFAILCITTLPFGLQTDLAVVIKMSSLYTPFFSSSTKKWNFFLTFFHLGLK